MAHAKASGTSPEARLKKIRRLETNMRCPNCNTTAPMGIGFGNVCVKFSTFVCDMCKTSHQAISHRVKSVTMSNWTAEEVDALTDEHGGGNEAARQTWLKNAPPCGGKYSGGSRPKQGDRVDIFKKFIQDCYDGRMFATEAPYVPNSSVTVPPITQPTQSGGPSRRAQRLENASIISSHSEKQQTMHLPQPPPRNSLQGNDDWANFDPFGVAESALPTTKSSGDGKLLEDFTFNCGIGSSTNTTEEHNVHASIPSSQQKELIGDWSPFTDSSNAPVALASTMDVPAKLQTSDLLNNQDFVSSSCTGVAISFDADPFGTQSGRDTDGFSSDPFANAPSFVASDPRPFVGQESAPIAPTNPVQSYSLQSNHVGLNLSVPLAHYSGMGAYPMQPYTTHASPQYDMRMQPYQMNQGIHQVQMHKFNAPNPQQQMYQFNAPNAQQQMYQFNAPNPHQHLPPTIGGAGMTISHRPNTITSAFGDLSPNKDQGVRGTKKSAGGDSFDFLQDSMQKQLNNSGGRGKRM